MASSVRQFFPSRQYLTTDYRREGGLERFNMTSTASTRMYTRKVVGPPQKKENIKPLESTRTRVKESKRDDFSSILRKRGWGGKGLKEGWRGAPHAQYWYYTSHVTVIIPSVEYRSIKTLVCDIQMKYPPPPTQKLRIVYFFFFSFPRCNCQLSVSVSDRALSIFTKCARWDSSFGRENDVMAKGVFLLLLFSARKKKTDESATR